jgi:hypothetical protein
MRNGICFPLLSVANFFPVPLFAGVAIRFEGVLKMDIPPLDGVKEEVVVVLLCAPGV